jgi:hypothetical protein
MTKIVFEPPSADSPGYLRRSRMALEFRQKASGDFGPKVIDDMIEFLLPYVKEPVDRTEAREALLDATQTQFFELIDAVSGESKNPTSAQPKNEPSSAGQAE